MPPRGLEHRGHGCRQGHPVLGEGEWPGGRDTHTYSGRGCCKKSVNGRGGELWVTRERSEMGVSLLWYWSLWTAHHGGFVEDHCRDPSCLHARITQGCSANFKEKKKNRNIELECLARPLPLIFPSKNPRRACSAIFGENQQFTVYVTNGLCE